MYHFDKLNAECIPVSVMFSLLEQPVQNEIEKNKRFNFKRQNVFSSRKCTKQLNTKFHFQFMLKFHEIRKRTEHVHLDEKWKWKFTYAQCMEKFEMWFLFGKIHVCVMWSQNDIVTLIIIILSEKREKTKNEMSYVVIVSLFFMKSEWSGLILMASWPQAEHRHTHLRLLIRAATNDQRSSWMIVQM